MANKSIVSNSKLDALAKSIAEKAGASLPMTVDAMKTAVDGIEPGGGDIDSLVENKFSGEYAGTVGHVGQYKFQGCGDLTAVKITPKGGSLTIGQYAFAQCAKLASFEIVGDAEVTVYGYVFQNSSLITNLEIPLFDASYNAFAQIPNLETFRGTHHRPAGYTGLPPLQSPFFGCYKLKTVDLDMAMTFGGYQAHWNSAVFDTLIIRDTEVVATLSVNGLFNNANCFANKTAKIYVPDALVEDYKAATNWVTYADLIHPLSEYTE